jgi:phage-related protein
MAIKIEVAGSYNDRDIKRAQADLQALSDAAGGASRTFGEKFAAMGDSMVAFGSTMTTRVTLPIVAAGAAMFAAFTGEEDAIARMEATIRATGGVAGVTSDHIRDLASSLQDTTTFADDATIGAAALLLTFKNLSNAAGDGNDVFDRTISASQDLSALMGTDLNSAVMTLGKALQDPAAGLARLTRIGIQFTDEQKNQIQALADSGDMLGAQKLMLAEVESQFGGTAEAMAQTSSGKIKQSINTLGDAAEGFGEIIARVVDKVSGLLNRVGDFLRNLSPETKELIVTALGILAAIGPVVLIVGKLMGAIVAIKGVFAGLAAAVSLPVLAVIAVIVALAAAVWIAWQRSEEFRNGVKGAWEDIREAAMQAWEGFIKPTVEQLVKSFNEDIMPALDRIAAKFNEVWPGIRDAILSAWGYIQPILNFLVDVLTVVVIPALLWLAEIAITTWISMAVTLSNAWTQVIQPVFSIIAGIVRDVIIPAFVWLWQTAQTVWAGVSSAISTAWGFISGVFESIKGGISSVASWFGDRVENIKSVFSGIADAISGPFRTAFNFIADAWNNTIGNLSWTIPSWVPGGLGGNTISAPKLPTFNKGGMVPGIPGDPQLAIVHAGEMILRQSQIDNYAANKDTRQAPAGDVNVYVTQSDADPYQIGQEILWRMKVAG